MANDGPPYRRASLHKPKCTARACGRPQKGRASHYDPGYGYSAEHTGSFRQSDVCLPTGRSEFGVDGCMVHAALDSARAGS